MDALELLDYRAAVARMYLAGTSLTEFRAERDKLFATHPQSAIASPSSFTGLRYYPPNEDAIVEAEVRPADGEIDIDTGGPDGVVHYERAGIIDTPYGELSLWTIKAYGGGLFLPVRDATCGRTTYGGGRYLTDTVKGTFGRGLQMLGGSRVRLDFNYLYNPSCAYNDAYLCPLAPPSNTVAAPIEAGELTYH
ncbi:DUF1684 domain-containing protein [Paractinoplanes brasiliensis]|uniref:DUF1684 domain-containing protein n=1 Tax=Paractinoplanes brasiliensis TaxID=52695 RepID=A0A4R6JXL6_9ACTN|nr:DUF1684 domain-containing protein [Actinoplanes brasiliensis]TDO41117.1 hypothetical protein C8E87_4846 [Actinoplanes brasiliensis]GID26187.1 hypothetical protein Abr02nite_11700 [Actinoplanes brasiliensis]